MRLNALGSLWRHRRQVRQEEEVDPFDHLIGTAIGWGGNPRIRGATIKASIRRRMTARPSIRLTLKDVPVDGFWSISVYNAKGFFEKNSLNAYSLNNLTAKPNPRLIHRSVRRLRKDAPNCLPIMKGWNYTVRLYRPRKEILDGSWKLPEAQPAQ